MDVVENMDFGKKKNKKSFAENTVFSKNMFFGENMILVKT